MLPRPGRYPRPRLRSTWPARRCAPGCPTGGGSCGCSRRHQSLADRRQAASPHRPRAAPIRSGPSPQAPRRLHHQRLRRPLRQDRAETISGRRTLSSPLSALRFPPSAFPPGGANRGAAEGVAATADLERVAAIAGAEAAAAARACSGACRRMRKPKSNSSYALWRSALRPASRLSIFLPSR